MRYHKNRPEYPFNMTHVNSVSSVPRERDHGSVKKHYLAYSVMVQVQSVRGFVLTVFPCGWMASLDCLVLCLR